MRQRLFEGDHRAVAQSLNNLGRCLQSLGRSEEALPKYEAALEMFRRVLPPADPQTLYTQTGLAETLVMLRQFGKAEQLLRDAAEQCERSDASWRRPWRNVLRATADLLDAWHAAEPDQGYDTKAAEWRAKLGEEGTEAARHEGTKGKEPASQASTQPATEQAEPRGNDPK